MSDDANTLPVLVVPMKIDADVVASVTLWLLLNYDSPEQAREVLAETEISVVTLQYKYSLANVPKNKKILVFDVGGEYIPNIVYDHNFSGGADSATGLVWEEFKNNSMTDDQRVIYERLVVFLNNSDSYRSFFDPGQILLERISVLLKLTNVSILNNSAFGPAHLPNAVAKMLKKFPNYFSLNQARDVLLRGFDLIYDWYKEELDLIQLSKEQEVRSVSDLVDVVSVTTKLLPDRLRYLYNRLYRFQLKKFYVLVAIVQYPTHQQLVVQKMLPSALAKVDLVYLANWLSGSFKISYKEINLFKENNILSVRLPDDLEYFYIQRVADYLRYNIKCKEDDRLFLLTKLFTKVLSFVAFHNDNQALLSATFDVFWRMLRLVQKVDDLKPFLAALEEMEANTQLRSESYPELPIADALESNQSLAKKCDLESCFQTVNDEAELQGVFASSVRNQK